MKARPIWDNRGVSRKMTCPGCDAHTSSVVTAFDEGDPCPYCGLPATATEEILDARKRAADADLTRRYEDLVKRVAGLEAERNALRSALNNVKQAVRQADDAISKADEQAR